MGNEDLSAVLFEKFSAEQDKYREWLLSQPPEEILNHTYEYTVREDILCTVENGEFPEKMVAALLRGDVSIADIFKDFTKDETDYMSIIRETLESRGNAILRDEFKQRNAPVYPNPVSYASEHDELEQYRASYKANTACKQAIEEAINGNYKDWSLDSKSALAQVSELFSMERIAYVLAATVQHKDWDGRLSDTNKAWAKTVPVCEDRNTYAFVVDQAHTGLVDLFVNQVRKELAVQTLQQVKPEERKPSVMEKLKAAPVKNAPKISAHSKGQER